MALTPQQSFDCLGCSSGDRNIYVDDTMKAMIAFLTRQRVSSGFEVMKI